ncbi:aminoglycoside phosphotransferase family protein [Rhizobium laguerreae]|uniref:phosphotransferase family protein n=1 Tax=Rhizobium laguerreae TaxID=1076926 RepID=UPI0014429B4F|nr:aminoglycoside phosphotransferase family protein [Rhizobium laguerreae]MBY3086824.1 aminoglycoside phosphotransferase family protein [Rhizobium laguerreae]MBY3147232.1 aminoglycoside phosphotransferase family protein [Rhizobium laguerreae]MBY3185659.1 aminoglycoside phosphotransferase family protein [Rhizobium laguerreae]NKM28963.1 phosphotransferase [Rhizobium laguerreae]NKM31063.1 phosphotransferase [Rhizobium laguerreae]
MTEIGRLLGSGKEAEVFEYGALALKLYRRAASKASSFREAANLSILERLALPAPKVHAVGEFDGRWGVLMDRAPDQFVSTAESAPLEDMAQLHRRLHEKPGDGLPSLMARLSARIRRAEGLDAASRNRLLLELDSLPDGDRVCHGDFHPWNIHGSGQGFMIVDWLDACCGNPLADVCRTYVLLHHAMPDRAMGYVEAYASVTGSEVSAILAWLPAIAAARLTEGVANENDELLQLAGVSR